MKRYDATGVTLDELGDYRGLVFSWCYKAIRHRESAEDAAQETMRKVVERWGLYEPSRPFGPWLFTVTRHVIQDAQKAWRRRRETSLEHEPVDPIDPERIVMAREGLRLVTQTRDLTVLWALGEGVPVKEVARLMGWSESKVKVRAHRARRNLTSSGEESDVV